VDGTVVQLQLWGFLFLCIQLSLDIAGQERFGNMTRVYYKQAVAAIVVFDVTDAESFEGVKIWKKDIDSKVYLPDDQTPIPTILIGNKVRRRRRITSTRVTWKVKLKLTLMNFVKKIISLDIFKPVH
jgi:GTPase SAR1 family protein